MTEISGGRIRAHVKFLSSDLLEGRGVGARGGELATEYIATQFALLGVKPAGENGTYFQKVSLVGSEPQPSTRLIAIPEKESEIPFRWLDDFVGVNLRQTTNEEFDAPAIFVGHGITAPEYNWDDYRDTDVRGKVVVLFTNEPPSDDPKFFTGKALTYYGRWTYKYEEAARRGAIGAIIIHTKPTASYGWDVVRSSWGREDQHERLAPGEYALSFAGWVTTDAGERVAATIGKSVDELLHMADTRGFRPVSLPLRFRVSAPTKIRQIETRNVIGRVEGADPELKNEAVVFSAHWDHLGLGEPVDGDPVYHGAVDNGTGCAMLLELARAWAALPQKPRRSALFVSVTSEEAGLLGSRYFGDHPPIPAGKIALAINYDGFQPWGRSRDVVVIGSERTSVFPVVQEAARRFNLTIAPDPQPEAGLYYRSDHFSFARAGIPAFSIEEGRDLLGKPPGTGEKLYAEWLDKRYHQPTDRYNDDWDVSGMEEYARFGLLIGTEVANSPKLPTWRDGDEFLPARQRSLAR
ncbi:MAG: M28 family peptidase [Bryobacterales bacterium]|nr:M28 family peptidase [Bryobacterales bacterium]MBV9399790.1 M28 family peptidase [Bryobacterales bacterium]